MPKPTWATNGKIAPVIDKVKTKFLTQEIGRVGEAITRYWLARSGYLPINLNFENANFPGIDILASNNVLGKKIGVTVKTRLRPEGQEDESVFVFMKEKRDLEKAKESCWSLGAELWIAVYVEDASGAVLYMTSEANYTEKYRSPTARDGDWKMTPRWRELYKQDPGVLTVEFKITPDWVL